jgi:undecaprenyl phosphate N,N'-diacetylbacillosamine 1-phosphate transferase
MVISYLMSVHIRNMIIFAGSIICDSMYKEIFKRIVDFTIALAGLILLLPVFLLVAVLLYFSQNSQPFFFQSRPGKQGRLFTIIKFKTMNDAKDIKGELKPDSERLTKVGSWIRKSSLDELPQLINVLKGDMSIVGPRPLLPGYLHLYNDFQNRRHEVKPGITGWAQVNGRNAISWDKKFEYDVWYVDHISFLVDLKILLKTIQKVLQREGINAADTATIEPFHGK